MFKVWGNWETTLKGGIEMNSQRDILEVIVTALVLVSCVAMIVTGHDTGYNQALISSGFTGILTYWFTRSGVALGQSSASPTQAPISQTDIQNAVQAVLNQNAQQAVTQTTGGSNGQNNVQSNGVR